MEQYNKPMKRKQKLIRYELSKTKKLYAVYETPCTEKNCGSNCECKEYRRLINIPIIIK